MSMTFTVWKKVDVEVVAVDYVMLKIDSGGVITNWPKSPDVSAFFPREDER